MAPKPIKLHCTPAGPNPWKVAIVLEELQVPYEIIKTEVSELKKKPYTDLNPNGRSPAIEDPNNGLVLWESGAIIQYLIEQYDPEKKISYATLPEKYHLNQWLMFQMSGHGPYLGQCAWFMLHHPEPLPSARDRYIAEVKRIVSVLDSVLEGRTWLVGDKCTYADLSFVTWDILIPTMMGSNQHPERFNIDHYLNFKAWHERLLARESVKKCLETQKAMMEAEGTRPAGKRDDE